MSPTSPPLCITPRSPLWPPEYEHIEASPERLWLRGRTELLAWRPCVAIVGTRSPTPYGQSQARRYALAISQAGAVIVSGLARGIDQAAHAAALEVGGATIAVLGSGVDQPWPPGDLTELLVRDGLLLSEFEPGLGPRRHHFPLRNRLISGLSAAVVVIEAAQASGSLITARWAVDQGKLVYALPGRVDQPMARGCHRLIREGALLVEDPEEITAELGLGPATGSRSSPGGAAGGAGPHGDSALLVHLRGETLSADELSERTGRNASEILVELVELELARAVIRAPGGLYRLAERGG